MSVAIVTGSGGLVGSESVSWFASRGLDVVGIDNDMRRVFFGDGASTRWNIERLQSTLGKKYVHHELDIRDEDGIWRLFERYGSDVTLVIHAAAQPSHDWAASDPPLDFAVNANGTLNVLNATRMHAPEAAFIFTSTNKVYGDTPNRLPLVELETRWELVEGHEWYAGIPEEMSIDRSLHSVFGASKVAADVMVQEFGRYFGMKTACFRGGCLTGPQHSGTHLHGFLAYLVKCVATGSAYTVHGYGAKQVRDSIHSRDLVRAFDAFFEQPRGGEVYNIGGGRTSHCSMLEAIAMTERVVSRPLRWTYQDVNRIGDHKWWISDNSKFRGHYPEWSVTHSLETTITEIYDTNAKRWLSQQT